MAAIVATNEVIIVVPTISVGFAEPYCMRIAITVVGINVKPDVFNAKNVIIEREAICDLLNFFNSSIAFNPIGVAALPKPNILAVKFVNIYPTAG